jgi:hypothetical protein
VTILNSSDLSDVSTLGQALAAWLEAIGMQYVPEGWTVSWQKSFTGSCHHRERRLEAPRPVTRDALCVFLRVCGHAHLHGDVANRVKPAHVRECEAEQWAFKRMRMHGIATPRHMISNVKASADGKLTWGRWRRDHLRFRDEIRLCRSGRLAL